MNTIFLAFGAMICWGIGDFFIQKGTRKIGNVETLTWIGIIGTLGLLPFVFKDFVHLTDTGNLLMLSALGLITFFAAIANFEALKQGKLSVVEILLEIELPVTIALAFIFFKESFSILQYVLVVGILCGIVLIATKSFSHWKTKLEKGVFLAILAAVLMGIVDFLTAVSSKQISPLLAVWFAWVFFTILCIVILIKRNSFKTFVYDAKKFWIIILVMGIFDTLAWVFYSYAFYYHEIAITTAITESYPAIALLLGIIFNKERILWHQAVGIILAFVCGIVLATTI